MGVGEMGREMGGGRWICEEGVDGGGGKVKWGKWVGYVRMMGVCRKGRMGWFGKV